MPMWLQAGLWGFLAGAALLVGAAVGYFVRVAGRTVAAVMAFGSGVLISALAFELLEAAYRRGGLISSMAGFLAGATVYTIANILVNRKGARHRKRSGDQQKQQAHEHGASASGLAIAIGALLDGIPESIAVGLTLLAGSGVSSVMVVAVFLSNIPEGLSSAAGMKRAGRSVRYVFGVWTLIAVVSGIAATLGYAVFGRFSPDVIAATTTVAAGAILAMLADTMIPEAVAEAHDWVGLITVAGFLAAFALDKLGG